MWSRETTDDVNLVYGKGEWCDMCSSGIARVRAGGADYLEETSSVCVGEGCESERKRELATEREREEERGREGSFVSINGV